MNKILVYDADPRFREVLKAALNSFGYDAVVAADGYSVLPLVEQHKPNLLVLEYKLPESDGFEMMKRVRGVPAFALTPIIFASVTPKFELEMILMDAPAVSFIDKPLDAKQLKDAVESLIGKPKAAPRAEAPMDIPPPVFSGEPDLDGVRDDIIELE